MNCPKCGSDDVQSQVIEGITECVCNVCWATWEETVSEEDDESGENGEESE